MLRHLLLAALVFNGSVFAQGPPAATARANEAILASIDLLAAGDPGTAVRNLNNVAATTTDPAILRHAQCIGGAAVSMNGESRSAENLAGMLNRPAPAAQQAAAAVAMSDCIRELSAIALKVPPDKRAGLHYYLGLVGHDEAEHVRNLREATKLRPDFGEAVYQLAVHLMAQGEMDESAKLFRRVAEQHPEWAEPRANLGIVLNLTGHPADAVKELQEAVKIQPDYPEAHGQLGLALYGAGQLDDGLNECQRAARSEPDNPAYYSCAAVILLEKNRGADALAYARRANEMAPTHETFLVVLAAAQSDAGNATEALVTMRRAAEAQPRLRTDPQRLEKADLLRGRALSLASQLLQKLK